MKRDRSIEHFADVLAKKIKGECAEEQLYNTDASELKRLTGRDFMYIGPNARINMQRDLVAARKRAAIEPVKPDLSGRMAELSKKFSITPEDKLGKHADEWIKLKKQELEHATCTDRPVQCRGCNKQVCEHLSDYVCSSVAVCQWCDEYGQPNPFNPINRKNLLQVSEVAAELCKKIDNI